MGPIELFIAATEGFKKSITMPPAGNMPPVRAAGFTVRITVCVDGTPVTVKSCAIGFTSHPALLAMRFSWVSMSSTEYRPCGKK